MIVIDTNILTYHVVRGERTAATEQLLRIDPEWMMPPLWRSEFHNVLAGSLRRGLTSLNEAERLMKEAALCLIGGEHTVSDRAVLELVARSRCTAYDCEFVALADALGVVLVTEDKDVLKAFPRQCRSLTDAIKRGVKL